MCAIKYYNKDQTNKLNIYARIENLRNQTSNV